LNALQTNKILALAKSKGILAMEAIWIAFLPSIRTAMTEAQTGKFGAPYLLRADFGYPISPEQVASAMRPDSGVLMDRLVYPLSIAISFMGSVARVTIGGLKKTSNVDTDAVLHVEHSDGGISQMAISFNKIFDNEAVLYCEKGSIKISSPLLGSESIAINQWQTPDFNQASGRAEPRLENALKLKLKEMALFRQLNQRSNRLPLSKHSFGADQFLPMINHFANLLADGKTESPIVTHHLSIELARVVDLAKSVKH
jgi:predicted dehydrogenase